MLYQSKTIKNIFFSLFLFSSILEGASKHIQEYTPEIEQNITATNIKLEKGRSILSENDIEKKLKLFDISCDGIKYTGSLETVAIDYVNQTKEAIYKLFLPYTSLSSFEAVILIDAFTACFIDISNKEAKGDSVTSSALETILYAIGNIGRSGLTIIAGAEVSTDAKAGVKTTARSYVDIAGSLKGFIDKKIDEGWFDDIMECTYDKRTKIYTKLFELLNQQFQLKLNNETATFNQCNIELIQKDEKVPSWNSMFGNAFSEAMDSSLDYLNSSDTFNKKISEEDFCKVGEVDCKTPKRDGCVIGEPNCKPFTHEEVIEKTVVIGDDIEALGPQAKEDLDNLYPPDEGYIKTDLGNGKFKIEQTVTEVPGGEYVSKMPYVEALRKEWELEQEALNNQNNDIPQANKDIISPNTIPSMRQCMDGISSIGDNKCLTVEQAKDRKRLIVTQAPKTISDFLANSQLTKLETLIWNILYRNKNGFLYTLKYVYGELGLLKLKYSFSFKNLNKIELTHNKIFQLQYDNNFKLNYSYDYNVSGIENIFLQNESGTIKLLNSSEFSKLLLQKIVEDLTGKTIPLNKKIPDDVFETAIKIFKLHRDAYSPFIDFSSLKYKQFKDHNGNVITIDINDPDIVNLFENIEKWYAEQRYVLKEMFDHSTTINPSSKQQGIPQTTQNTEFGASYWIETFPVKDYRQELITRVNRKILELKLIGYIEEIKNITFFYKMFLYWNPTSFQDKVEPIEKALNNTIFADEKSKKAQLMHKIVLESILLEKSRNYDLMERHINKKDN